MFETKIIKVTLVVNRQSYESVVHLLHTACLVKRLKTSKTSKSKKAKKHLSHSRRKSFHSFLLYFVSNKFEGNKQNGDEINETFI